jgi:lipid II:glycine glycyltransferase (peptidoglycan interpeptide bridge formation enzyme)
MKFITVTNQHKEKYTSFVNNDPAATCMQMWEWADFRNSLWHNSHFRVGVLDKNEEFALAATYAINKFKLLGNVLYIPQGPIRKSEEALDIFSKEIDKIAKEKNCFAVICEPRIQKNSARFKEMMSSGFEFTNQAVQPRVTVSLDLTKSEDELLASFSRTTRYNIHYAQRKGIVIKKYNEQKDIDRIEEFYKLLKETQDRKYFQVQPLEYFKNLWSEFSKNGHITLYEAYFENTLLGSIIVVHDNVWATSMFSASSRKHSKRKPIYLARWESIKNAKSRGNKIYDFFGATDSKDKTHPFYHTTQYKLGFGRKLTKFAGTFERIQNPLKYKLWRLLENFSLFKFYERSFIRKFKNKNS